MLEEIVGVGCLNENALDSNNSIWKYFPLFPHPSFMTISVTEMPLSLIKFNQLMIVEHALLYSNNHNLMSGQHSVFTFRTSEAGRIRLQPTYILLFFGEDIIKE